MTFSSVSLKNDKYISPFGSHALQKYNLSPLNSLNEQKNDCFIKKHQSKNNSSIIKNIVATGIAAFGLYLFKKDIAKTMGKVITKIRKFIP